MKKWTTVRLTELALLIALEIIMGLTPLGYLSLPFLPLPASLLTIPVAIGAVLLGPAESTLLGLVFGIISFTKGFTSTGLMTRAMYAASIPGSFVVTVGGRVLMGLCTGLLVLAVRKLMLKKGRSGDSLPACLVGSFGAPILNTVFYMGLLMLLFYHNEYVQDLAGKLGTMNPILLIAAMVGTQAIIEAVTCGVIGTAVSKALQAAMKRRRA